MEIMDGQPIWLIALGQKQPNLTGLQAVGAPHALARAAADIDRQRQARQFCFVRNSQYERMPHADA